VARHHVVISGTGRAGTTFLVQLFTALGLDTGFTDLTSAVFPNCNAGMELDIRNPEAPYIIKSPHLCDTLDQVLAAGDFVIDHAIVPVRDLFSAAQSRREVSLKSDPPDFPGEVPGGLWEAKAARGQQEQVLASKLYELIHTVTKRDIPLTVLHFPRLVNDAGYLFRKLDFLLGHIPFETFSEVFERVSKPALVHNFTAEPTAEAVSVDTKHEVL
jgi:hypothetical protein